MKQKLLVQALLPIMLVDPTTQDYVDSKRPYVVNNSYFIKQRSGGTVPPMEAQIKVFDIALKDDATDAELAQFFKDSDGDEALAMDAFLSKWREGSPGEETEDERAERERQEQAAKDAQEKADKEAADLKAEQERQEAADKEAERVAAELKAEKERQEQADKEAADVAEAERLARAEQDAQQAQDDAKKAGQGDATKTDEKPSNTPRKRA